QSPSPSPRLRSSSRLLFSCRHCINHGTPLCSIPPSLIRFSQPTCKATNIHAAPSSPASLTPAQLHPFHPLLPLSTTSPNLTSALSVFKQPLNTCGNCSSLVPKHSHPRALLAASSAYPVLRDKLTLSYGIAGN